MTLNEYQSKAKTFMNPNINEIGQLEHSLFGLASEVGEVHGLFQKLYQGHSLDNIHLRKELGDVLWMLAELCTVNGIWMEDIAQLNIDKLTERYPNGFEEEKSLHRREGDI